MHIETFLLKSIFSSCNTITKITIQNDVMSYFKFEIR